MARGGGAESDPARHAREAEIFAAACDLSAQERAQLLERECGGDASMLARLRALLARDSTVEGSLDLPGLAEVSAALLEEELPQAIGRFRILRELGRGGMGIVYEAEQESPQRRVALKVLRSAVNDARTLRRFEHEARILGRLSHPGIAHIYDAGVAELALGPRPYLVMELVHGEPLKRFADLRGLDHRQCLELLATVCDAVQHAHHKGVIHRDLKPSNILVAADGAPKVLDFGIARALDEEPAETAFRTRTGDVLGTLAYMSPEQVSGAGDGIDTRSDVYSLGVIAYELLAGSLPYAVEGRPIAEAARTIAEEEPPRLGAVVRELRGDVETVVAKAMEKERERRYASAGELGLDLGRCLRHEPIAARPTSGFYQIRRFARRNPRLTAAVAVAAAALIGGTWVSWAAMLTARDSERAAREQTARAEITSVCATLSAAALATEARDPISARELLEAIAPEERGWEWRHLLAAIDGSALSLQDEAPLCDAAPARDGEEIVTVSTAGRVRRWSARDGEPLGSLELGPLQAAAFNADGAWVAGVSGAERTHVALWDTTTGALRAETTAAEPVNVLALSLAGDVVALGGPRLTLWHPDSGTTPTVELVGVEALAFDTGGERGLAVAYGAPPDRSVGWGWSNLVDTDTAQLTRKSAKVADLNLTGITLHARAARIAVSSIDRRAYVRDEATGEVRTLAGHRSAVACVAFDREGQRVATGSADQTVRLWDAASGAELAVLTGATGPLRRVRFLPDGSGLLGVSGSSVLLWRLGVDPASILTGHGSYVYGVAFLEDGRLLLSGAWDGTLRIWDPRTRECLGYVALGRSKVFAVAAGPPGTWFATALSGSVSLWSADTAERVAELEYSGPGRISALSASRDGELLAGRRASDAVLLWRTRERTLEREFPAPHGRATSAVALSADGRWLAADAGTNIVVWDRASGAELARLRGHTGDIEALAFSPDGSQLASGSVDRTVRLWETRTWSESAVLSGHTDRVYALAFSPDGARLASGSNDASIRIWGTRDGMGRGTLRGHRDYVYALAFSPDGECLASASGDTTVRLWETRPSRDVWAARERARRLRGDARAAWGEDAGPEEELVRRLRADPTLDAEQREAALQLVLQRHLVPDGGR